MDKHKLPDMLKRWSELEIKEKKDNESSPMKSNEPLIEAAEIKNWIRDKLLEDLIEKAVKLAEKEEETLKNILNDVKSKAKTLYDEWTLVKVKIRRPLYHTIRLLN